jgi:hypothetical protein
MRKIFNELRKTLYALNRSRISKEQGALKTGISIAQKD